MREEGPASPSLHDELPGKMFFAENDSKGGRKMEVDDDCDEG